MRNGTDAMPDISPYADAPHPAGSVAPVTGRNSRRTKGFTAPLTAFPIELATRRRLTAGLAHPATLTDVETFSHFDQLTAASARRIVSAQVNAGRITITRARRLTDSIRSRTVFA